MSQTELKKEILVGLSQLEYEVLEMSCTCVSRRTGHQRDCAGKTSAQDVRKIISKVKKLKLKK